MSDPLIDDPSTATSSSTTLQNTGRPPEAAGDAVTRVHAVLHALTKILPSPPPSALSSSQNPALSLLHDASVSSSISSLLRLPESGSGDNPLCRWLYETFQTRDAALQLVVLSYIPLLSGLYLKRMSSARHHTSGFEAVLLSLYSRETASRTVRTAVSVTIPKLSNPSLYHEPAASSTATSSTELHVGILSHALEPHSTVRATSRARVVGVALEVYYSSIWSMPSSSKLEFCESCEGWAGENGGLPWELMQPALRILGHCLMMPNDEFLHGKARGACRSLYARALHGIDPKAILATQSLIRMIDVEIGKEKEVDYTEVPITRIIST